MVQFFMASEATRWTTGAETTGVKQSDFDHGVVSWLPRIMMHDLAWSGFPWPLGLMVRILHPWKVWLVFQFVV